MLEEGLCLMQGQGWAKRPFDMGKCIAQMATTTRKTTTRLSTTVIYRRNVELNEYDLPTAVKQKRRRISRVATSYPSHPLQVGAQNVQELAASAWLESESHAGTCADRPPNTWAACTDSAWAEAWRPSARRRGVPARGGLESSEVDRQGSVCPAASRCT